MDKWIKRVVKRAQHYSIMDFAVFKMTLVSIGVLIGVYGKDFFGKHINKVWVIATTCGGAIMYRTLGPKARKK